MTMFINITSIKTVGIRKDVHGIFTTSGDFVPCNGVEFVDGIYDGYSTSDKGRIMEDRFVVETDCELRGYQGSQIVRTKLPAGTEVLRRSYGTPEVSGTFGVRFPGFAARLARATKR